jgi:hypothetical protein
LAKKFHPIKTMVKLGKPFFPQKIISIKKKWNLQQDISIFWVTKLQNFPTKIYFLALGP